MHIAIRGRRRLLLFLSATGFFILTAFESDAQVLRVHPQPINRPRSMLILTGSVTVSATPSNISFSLVPAGQATGSSTVTVTTAWTGVTGALITLNVYGYFSSSTQALTNSTDSTYAIPSSSVFGVVTGTNGNVPSYTAFTQTTPFSGASGLDLVSLGNLLTLGANGSFTNGLNLKIDLSSQQTLPAGTYAGSLNIVAQAL